MGHEGRPGRDRRVALVVPLLLLVVASAQMATALTGPLTPWRGGGFGMFSTLDNHDLRRLHITAITHDGDRLALDTDALFEGSTSIQRQAVIVRANPTDRNLEALARALVAGGILPADPDDGMGLAPEDVSGLELSVWRVRLDLDTARMWREPVGEFGLSL